MNKIDKKKLTETDIRTKFITPAIEKAGWDRMMQMREEYYFTDGPIVFKGKKGNKQPVRGKAKKVDYILYFKPDIPLAVVEAKDNKHRLSDGMDQALEYADLLDIPFVFTSNGDGFRFHDKTLTGAELEKDLQLDEFPSPEHLFHRYCTWKKIPKSKALVVSQDYYQDPDGKRPRYYQANAINRTLEAIAKGQNRILLTMATGTGKTFCAFQIIWRLWKAGQKKRILFLADRNVLVDQTMVNDFKPFKGAMAKLSKKTKTIERSDGSQEVLELAVDKKRGTVDTSYEIYLSLYQAITGPDESKKLYKQFSKDFFDLIVIDECHRGSADEDSEWREILEYFEIATQIGLTATPKETKKVSNSVYFGKEVYKYSLKQGIADGFLAPYRVIRVNFDKDDFWRPEKGKKDAKGQEVPDRVYNKKDYDKDIVMTQRNEQVANRIVEFLRKTSPYSKTIVFCEDVDHAERMRGMIANEAKEYVVEDSKYVMRITGDNKVGKQQLDNFIHPEERYPVIATTSRLMSTGVDAKTCKLIVLDRAIESMTEFKQIIGRGTRIDEDYDKRFFTIMDFRNATKKFADKEFDGDPVQIYEPRDGDDIVPDEDPENEHLDENEVEDDDTPDLPDDLNFPVLVGEDGEEYQSSKIVVKDVPFTITTEQVSHYDEDGKLVTESLRDYSKRTITGKFATLDDFLNQWTASEQKSAIIRELEKEGVEFRALAKAVGKEFDPFDLVCHVAFDQPALTRKERANNVKKKDYFGQYGEQARSVLEALLTKYANQGIRAIEDIDVLRVQPFDEMGSIVELIQLFGGRDGYEQAIRDLAALIYDLAA